MKLPRANYTANADAGTPIPENETEFGRFSVAFMDHELILSVGPGQAVMRVTVPGQPKVKLYVGMPGSRMLEFSNRCREAAYRADPTLRPAEQPLQAISGGKS